MRLGSPIRFGGALFLATLVVLSSLGGFASTRPASANAPRSPIASAEPPISVPSHLPSPSARSGEPSGASAGPPAVPIRLGTFDSLVPRPTGWPAGTAPPGAPILPGERPAQGDRSPPSLGHINTSWNNSVCAGLWPPSWGPGGAQGRYAAGCYGHDEPAIEFYSNLAGSGGNVSWNVTLPRDRSANDTQANLYVAVWFGLTLSDPYSWLHQCYLELQLYPDSTYGTGSGYDNWVGAAVGWQIQASSGIENACYYAPLGLDGSPGAYLNLAGGDSVTVRMEGWAGDPTGEIVRVSDSTSGTSSTVTLFNATAGVPLDPAFSSNAFDNSLLWTPGGEFPVSFAFETGHSANGKFPSNNSYGGCSAGVPPPTPQDGAVPCPSYDPGSWTNDSLEPWRIPVPIFFNAAMSMRPAQVGFGQPEGGRWLIDSTSNGSCTGRDGSAWCSYPWYSYNCADRAFEFGATDYPGTSADFGAFLQYGSVAETNGLGLGYYAPTNFSIPTCGATSYSIAIRAEPCGSVDFLSTPFPPNGSANGLGSGEYSIRALARAGCEFLGWTLSGNLTLRTPSTEAWGDLDVRGNGSILARFGSAVGSTVVTFLATGSATGAAAYVLALHQAATTPAIARLVSGGSEGLPPGTYEVQALPPVGSQFVAWSAGPGLVVASTTTPYTWLIVTGTDTAANLSASFSVYHATTTVVYSVWGSSGGSVKFNQSLTTSSASQTVSTGTWEFVATPSPGFVFSFWYMSGDGETVDPQRTTNVTLEGGTFDVYAYFLHAIRINVVSAGAATINVVYSGQYHNGETAELYSAYYPFASEPAPGYAFATWSSSNASAAWILSPTSAVTYVEVNASATVTATFVTASPVRLTFDVLPSMAGTIAFNGGPAYSSGSVNSTLTDGTYLITFNGGPGYLFSNWTTTGPVAVSSGPAGTVVTITGTDGTLTARFIAVDLPVTFDAAGDPRATATLNGTTLSEDQTLELPRGVYSISVLLPGPNDTFVGWWGTPGLSVSNGSLTVDVPGTIYALVAPFALSAPAAVPQEVRLNGSLRLVESVHGVGPFNFAWQGLPGCPAGAAQFSCVAKVSGTFSISAVVMDSYGNVATSPPTVVQVDAPRLLAIVSANPNATDIGQPVVISVAAQNGIGPFAYGYTSLPPGCSDQNVSTLTCVPTGPFGGGLVRVTDSIGLTGTFLIVLAIHPVPTLAPNGTGGPVDQGSPAFLSVALSGGTAPFTFAWTGLPSGCASLNRSAISCIPSAIGRYGIVVTGSDGVGVTYRASFELLVVADPSVTLFPNPPSEIDIRAKFSFGVTVSGGILPYSISLRSAPAGCTPSNGSAWTCTATVLGIAPVDVRVTDSDGMAAEANATMEIVAPPAIAAFTATPGEILVGSELTILVTVSGGSGGFHYGYSGLPTGCPSVDVSEWSCAPSSVGRFSIAVHVTDSSGFSAHGVTNLSVEAPFSLASLWPWLVGASAGIIAVGLWLVYRRSRNRRSAMATRSSERIRTEADPNLVGPVTR